MELKESIAVGKILKEYKQASEKFSDFHSTHEGYAVILEELDELWEEIKNNSNDKNLENEAVQVAAMGLRFIVDCCYK